MEKNLKFRVGAMLLKPVFKRLRSRFNYEEYGGAPLLGVNGVCVIAHGAFFRPGDQERDPGGREVRPEPYQRPHQRGVRS